MVGARGVCFGDFGAQVSEPMLRRGCTQIHGGRAWRGMFGGTRGADGRCRGGEDAGMRHREPLESLSTEDVSSCACSSKGR